MRNYVVNITTAMHSLLHACLLLLTLSCNTAMSAVLLDGQPYDRILQTAEASAENDTISLVIDTVLPVQYDWRFPTTPAREVIIALRLLPIPYTTDGRIDYREHLDVPPTARNVVQDIAFESNDGHGNFLVLRFAHAVTVTVSPGSTAFQLRITIHPTKGNTAPDNKDSDKDSD